MKFDPSLQTFLWGTNFGDGTLSGVVVDSRDDIWISGSSETGYLPIDVPNDGTVGFLDESVSFVAELPPDGSSVLDSTVSQFGGMGLTRFFDGTLVAMGPSDALIIGGSSEHLPPLMVANSANSRSTGSIAPMELISLFGYGIGPQAPMIGQVVDGAYTNRLGGYQVLFNDLPAPVLYADSNQINVVAPASIADQKSVNIEVRGPTGSTSFPTVFVVAQRPQIFSHQEPFQAPFVKHAWMEDYPTYALSQDFTAGQMTLTIWATGVELSGTPLPDGAITLTKEDGNLPIVVLSWCSNSPLDVVYAGPTPGGLQGLTQIDIRIPLLPFSTAGPLSFCLQTGGITTPSVVLF